MSKVGQTGAQPGVGGVLEVVEQILHLVAHAFEMNVGVAKELEFVEQPRRVGGIQRHHVHPQEIHAAVRVAQP